MYCEFFFDIFWVNNLPKIIEDFPIFHGDDSLENLTILNCKICGVINSPTNKNKF